jgi:hypothetical protein
MIPPAMRLRVFTLTLIFLMSTISPAIASDTVTTTDTEISGNYTLNGNITVSKGTTLTLKPGAVIDMQSYWIEVDGTLIANDVEIMSTIQPTGSGSTGSGVWDDITITSNGTAHIHNTSIANAKSCLINDGNLYSSNLTLQNCIIGIENSGYASITDFDASDIDQEGMRNTGTAELENIDFSTMSGGVKSSSDLDLSVGTFAYMGYGVSLSAGNYDVSNLQFTNSVAAGASIFSGASGIIDGMSGTAGNAITVMDSTGFTVSNVDMSGERLINSWSAGDLTIDGAIFESDSSETPIDIITSGDVILNEIELTGSFSSLQGNYDAPWIAIALSGSGDYSITESSIEATDVALKASGTGTVTIENSEFSSDRMGMEFTSLSGTDISQTTLNMSAGSEKGVDILQGIHAFTDFEINTPFNQFATNTVGIEAWYAEFTSQSLSVNGFSEGMLIHESKASFDDLTILDSNNIGLGAYSSSVDVEDLLETRTSDTGIEMENSIMRVRTWSSSNHEDGANLIDAASTLTSWSTSSIGTLFYDAKGAGEFNYGSAQTLVIGTDSVNRIYDVTVSFEDLVGNSIDATWESLGFTGVANSGTALVPVLDSGSQVLAKFAGVGTVSTTSGSEGGTLLMQVPIMPQGDWLLPGGQTIVLGATDDGSAHTATGNITVPANSHLIVESSTLNLPNYAKLTVNTLGSVDGVDAEIIGNVEIHSDGFASNFEIPSIGATELVVEGDVLWTSCQNSMDSYNLQINGDIQLDNSCQVTINSGNNQGNVTVGIGAKFEIVNTLEITVLNKGEPVQGATISVQGQSQTTSTDSEGKATRTASAIVVDSSGTTESFIENITMQWNEITEYITWNPTSSKEHTFTVSTMDGGSINEFTELERIWSPYYLSSDLHIPSDQTMTIQDGVALRVSEGVTITVEGVLNAGYSTISSTGGGARWAGLIVGGTLDTKVNLVGTNLVEGSPLISIDDDAQVLISNGLISRSGGAEPLIRINAMAMVDISSTSIMDSSSNCIEIQLGELSIYNSEIKNCADDGIWARGSLIHLQDVTVEDNVTLEGVDGGIYGLEANAVSVSNLDGFNMEDLKLGYLSGIDNREIIIEGLEVTGSPAVDFDNTAGSISDFTIDCGGTGIGVTSHHGRASSSMMYSAGTISSCTKGIDLHTDGESSPLILDDVDISANVAISSDGNPVIAYAGSMVGSVDIDNSRADLYDVEPTVMTVSGGEIMVWSTHIVNTVLGGNSIETNIEVVVEGNVLGSWKTTTFGSSVVISIPHILVDENGSETYDMAVIKAETSTLPVMVNDYEIGLEKEYIITVQLIPNQAPSAEIIIPDEGHRAMETEVIEIRALISDDLDSNEELEIEWNVVVGQTSVMQLFGEWNNITDLPQGLYVLTLTVTDDQGEISTDSMQIEITPLDSDGDYTSTCNEDSWYDKENNLNCGPDIFDTDDDNDNSLDVRDAWPLDPCASLDTDNDGQPDDLHCPPGITTWLTVDADDDGDGIPDSLESSSDDEESGGSSIVILAFVFMFIAAAVLLLRRKQGVE